MKIILFEDDQVGKLSPVSISRAAFAVSCGTQRLVDLASELGELVGCVVRPHLEKLQEADSPCTGRWPEVHHEGVLLVNARVVPSRSALVNLKQLAAGPRSVIAPGNGIPAAVWLAADHRLPAKGISQAGFQEWISGFNLPQVALELPMFEYPHDIVRHHQTTLSEHLEHRLGRGGYEEVRPGVFVGPDACLGSYLVTETKRGPIVIESGASIGPYCYLAGPVYVGRGARVIEHAALKDGVALGHTTKIGGEVEASIIEPYTNKQHHGFLGHSYLGSWINLGAGTCNSDLKNTYGTVKMEYQGRKVCTDMQFIGTIMGDYAKTAINTGIFTGKTIGVCSMVYGFVTTNVPSFVNYARLFGQVTEAPVEVMISAQARMFARRNVTQRPCDVQLLTDMYELTRHERQIAGEPLAL